MEIKRGDFVLVDLNPTLGSEQGGVRPCLILQNNNGNKYSPLTIVAPITSKKFTKEFPTNVFISSSTSGLNKDSTILLNQIKTIDKSRIKKIICSLDSSTINKVDCAIKISLGLN